MCPYAEAYWSLWDTHLGPISAINTHTILARAVFIRLGTIGIMLDKMGKCVTPDTKMGLHGGECVLVNYQGTRQVIKTMSDWWGLWCTVLFIRCSTSNCFLTPGPSRYPEGLAQDTMEIDWTKTKPHGKKHKKYLWNLFFGVWCGQWSQDSGIAQNPQFLFRCERLVQPWQLERPASTTDFCLLPSLKVMFHMLL